LLAELPESVREDDHFQLGHVTPEGCEDRARPIR
jgi:hypothetical protein